MSKEQDALKFEALREHIVKSLNIKQFYIESLGCELKIKSDGYSNLVHCPFHNDTGKPNFSISVFNGGFKCFACGARGSIFDFWARKNGFADKQGFQEAVVALANLGGVDIAEFNNNPTIQTAVPEGNLSTPFPKYYAPKINKAKAYDESHLPLSKQLSKDYHAALKPEHYKYLNVERGLTQKTISLFQIGWDEARRYKNTEGVWVRGKFMIPVFDKDGELRNFRHYASDTSPDMKMLNLSGYGSPPRLFPLEIMRKKNWENVVIVEGEFDCMLLNQKFEEAGLSSTWGAVTNTAGCNTFEAEWVEEFYGKNVFFCLDVDAPGKAWAITHVTKLFLDPLAAGKIESVRIVTLPLDGLKGSKDIGDFFIKQGREFSELFDILQFTPLTEVGGTNNDEASVGAIELTDFVSCVKDKKYIDQRVTVPITISGQSTKLYHATKEFRVKACPLMKEDNCCSDGGCQIVPYGDELFIESSCITNKRQLEETLRSMACTKQQRCTIEEVQKVVMQEFFCHQVIKRLTAEENDEGRIVNCQELESIPAYVLQPDVHMQVGMQDYIATGYIRSHPTRRNVSFLIEHLEPQEDDWKSFKLNDRTIRDLKAIQGMENVKTILNELTNNVTHIYQADDILLTVLLTYLAPLRYAFNGEFIRGWLNACVIGDTGTGKSATYMRISDWLELGDLFSALSGTRTGLLYAMKQRGVEWYVQVGRYVMASGKIIAIDETQETDAEEIKQMSKAMDEGWLSVSKVASGGYATETRTLFLMNPKHGKKISDYAYGCLALAECFHTMFIRRIDVAVFATGKDEYEFYNKTHDPSEKKNMKLTPEIFKSLVFWAWTRSVNDVHWSEGATLQCLASAGELANVYGHADDVPLVCPQDFRNTLARLSTAFAVLSGSFTADYTGVEVLDKHVIAMSRFVDVLYSSSACNLKQHAKMSGKRKIMRDYDTILETFTKAVSHAKNSPDPRWSEGQHFLQLVLILQHQQFCRKRDLIDQLNVTAAWVHKHVSILQMHNLVELGKHGAWKATRRFNLFMQKWQQEDGIDKMLECVYEKVGKFVMQGDLNSGGLRDEGDEPTGYYGEAIEKEEVANGVKFFE